MNGRWWEYYAVRYLVGSIVGAVIILYLATDSCSPFKVPDKDAFEVLKVLKESKFLGVTVLAALGFAFCYIASSPILIFHACRVHLRFLTFSKQQRKFTCRTFFAIVVTIFIVAIIYCIYFPSLARIPMVAVVTLQIMLLSFVFFDWFKTIQVFYDDLAKARTSNLKPKVERKDYITSYRHLREHGNAIAIIVLEVVLADALLHSPSIIPALFILVIWIIPGAFAWIIGTVLELEFVYPSRH